MKNPLFVFVFLCITLNFAKAQTKERRIMFKTIGQDSIAIGLNDEYFLIEDDCAQIIRYAHYNFTDRIFSGHFKDVSKAEPSLVVSEGYYNEDGQKNGPFFARYLNGNLRAKGSFKNNAYDGKWEMYYDNGKPEVNFEVTDGEYTITEAWKADGTKVVAAGTGVYINDMRNMYWKGKLLNGKPDGTWKLTNAASGNTLYTEHFKKGAFQDGSNDAGTYTYTDKSHIQFVSFFKMPLSNVEAMYFSPVICNGVGPDKVASARHKDGNNAFGEEIKDLISPFLSTANLKELDNSFTIEGEISVTGEFTNMRSRQAFREDLARGIINRLKSMRDIIPATVNGQPVSQKFSIKFVFSDSVYQFSYQLLQVETK
ncbi:hypothetical protein IDJ77_26105 [Mucilaginibacter sp. ZT4R22]|uniref:MORN repeat protein n=1 Tax=Mucilaginibacter pankratovii TaxID=2772110 RepID=A0ABR7WYE8_9SPHI|nr:hypothetical protein [Mucilaginibacter pankratovii]MBD1367313.1 hypothetical protein [Mucilaginibacter pankratovii]